MKILTFLGTGKYLEAFYSFGGSVITKNPVTFIQEALVEFLIAREPLEVCIFLTEDARSKNWLGKNESKVANFESGLKSRLETKFGNSDNFIYTEVNIPDGKNEEEIWNIFEKIVEVVHHGDTIVFDITHSFRYIPMLSFIAINYLKLVKKIQIENVFYAALEALGTPAEVSKIPLENRIVPIFDMIQFITLFDWSLAVEKFLETGRADSLFSLTYKEIKGTLSSTKGAVGGKVRSLIEALKKFTEDVATSRGPDLFKDLENVKQAIKPAKMELQKDKLVRPFLPLMEIVEEKFKSFSMNTNIHADIGIVEWCLEHDLVQQGYTILRESVINFVIRNYLKQSLNDSSIREKVERHLNKIEMIEGLTVPEDLYDLWRNLAQARNDINHSGWRKNRRSSEKLKKELNVYKEKFKKFIENQ